MAASMPMMATTIMSSIRVKPFWTCFMDCSADTTGFISLFPFDSAPALAAQTGGVWVDVHAFLARAVLVRSVGVQRKSAAPFTVLADGRNVGGAEICGGFVVECVVERSTTSEGIDGVGPVGGTIAAGVIVRDPRLEEYGAAQLRHILHDHFTIALT